MQVSEADSFDRRKVVVEVGLSDWFPETVRFPITISNSSTATRNDDYLASSWVDDDDQVHTFSIPSYPPNEPKPTGPPPYRSIVFYVDDDDLSEDVEKIILEIGSLTDVNGNPSPVLAPLQQSVIIKILDNDVPELSFTTSSQEVWESDKEGSAVSASVGVKLSNLVDHAVSVPIYVYSDTATRGSDYTVPNAAPDGTVTVTIDPFEWSNTVTFASIVNDVTVPKNESTERLCFG